MAEEVIKRGKPATFWIVLTSVFWILFFLICNTVITLLVLNDTEIQKVFAGRFNNKLGIEVSQQKSDSEVKLEKENSDLKIELQACQIEVEVIKRVNDQLSTVTPEVTPTNTINEKVDEI